MQNDLNFPKYLSIQTTSLCNASCIFCPYKEIKDIFPRKIMEMDLYRKIIDECNTRKEVERIILYMNNEPLTDPYLIERIDYAKEKIPWASVHILTNGLLLTDETAEKLINSKLDWIGISFHGIRKDTIEGSMRINYDIAFRRINNFVNKAKRRKNIKDYLMVTFLKHEYLSLEEKGETIDFWRSKGIERISYFDGPISRAGNVQDLPKVYHRGKITGCNSIWADEMIHIVEDGKVVLCCMDWRREVILGDLNKESIYDVWNGQRKDVWEMIYAKKDMPEEFLCQKCEESGLESLKRELSQEDEELILVMTPPWQTKMVPLGLAYLSSFLSAKGINVKVVDLNVKLFNGCENDKRHFWNISTINSFTPAQLAQNFVQEFAKELNDFIKMVCRSSAKLIGFSTTVASINIAVYLARQIKSRDPSKVMILGGAGSFWGTSEVDPERLIDIFVVGEGELPLLNIVKRFNGNESLTNLLGIQGTIICIDKIYHTFLPSNPVKNIDEIPFPEFLEFDLDEYNKENMYKPLPLLISRGCVNRCSFCVDHKMNYPFRYRNHHKIAEEIKFHLRQHRKNEFEFNDLLCNGNLKQLEQICDLIINENLDIRWSSYAAIREGMDLELFKKMKRAGCKYICYGMESASDVVLKKMNKEYNSLLAEEVIRNTYNAGIETGINIIIGHPGESEREFKNTCKFIQRNKDYIGQITNVSTCFLIPGSDLIRNFKKYGIYFKPSWKSCAKLIFKKKVFTPNYREFYAYPDNTPSARARRMRRLLLLLSRLNVPHIIVNYEKKYDMNLDKFAERVGKSVNVFKYKHFKLDFSQKRKCKLYFRDEELTKDVGMNTSFNINKKWFDSSSAKWKVRSFGKVLDIDMKWSDIAVSQHWLIKFVSKGIINWEVKTYFGEQLDIFQHKIGLIVSNKYDKYTVEQSTYNFPDLFTNNWEEVLFSPLTKIELSSDALLSSIILTGESNEGIFSQLQNSPIPLRARMANFCFLKNADHKDYNNEGYRINKGDMLEGSVKIYLKP